MLAGRNVYIDMYGHTHPHTEFRGKKQTWPLATEIGTRREGGMDRKG